jgi:deazaflavin-dependent oxidoreductase (nitroreductase family)
VLDHVDRWVYRRTRGRHTLAALVSGLPVVMLTTTGARSGRPHSVPVLGLPAQGTVAVAAADFGARAHPGWYHNLRADPHATVGMGGTLQRVCAVEAEGERREQIVRDGLRIYPGFSQYMRRAANRRIAIFVLEPVSGSTSRSAPRDEPACPD